MKPLNKEKALALFEDNAILIGHNDAIPEETVAKLFGEEAVAHARALDGENYDLCRLYGIGRYQQSYLTLQGFLTAATYSNVHLLELEKAELEREPEGKTEEVELFDEQGVIRAITAMFLDYMNEVAEAGNIVDTDEDNAKMLAELEAVTGAKPTGMLAKLFLAYSHGFDSAIKAVYAGLDVERANE